MIKRIFYCHLFVLLLCLIFLFPTSANASVHVEVEIKGVSDKSILNNIHNLISIEKYGNEPDLTDFSVKKMFEKAPAEIQKAVEPFGYYKADINSKLIREDGKWKAIYRIKLGKPLHVARVDLKISGPGAHEKVFRQLKENFPLKPGDILDQKAYENAKSAISEAALDFGYLQGKFNVHTLKVYLDRLTATVQLHFDTGPLFLFGKVTIGQDILDPEFIHSYVHFKEGDPYRTSALLELQAALSQSGYFKLVEVRPLLDHIKSLHVPVVVKTEPMNRHKYSLGAGYGTDTGLRMLFGWEYRRVNHGGHHFNTDIRLSQIKQDIIARYTIPVSDPQSDHIDFSSAFTSEDTNTATSKKFSVGTSFTHKRDSWLETEYINFQRENFKVDDESGFSRLFIPGVSLLRVVSDDPLYPTRGYKLNLDVKGTTSLIGSNVTFIQARIDAIGIRSFWEKGRFILKTHLGFTEVDKFSNLPASLRFFAGGENSIRGYSYNSLGPRNSSGSIVGGEYLLAGSIEYEHIIYDKWSLAVFYDMGNALHKLSDPLKQGTGIGVRWRSPVGPIKVDISRGLSTPEGGWKLSFNVGPEL